MRFLSEKNYSFQFWQLKLEEKDNLVIFKLLHR